jgi:EmrB/QacA subfamily drug resistance transporter
MALRRRGLAITVLIVAQFMDLVDSTITNVALPAIQKSLGTTAAQLEWTMASYMLAFAVLLITGGRLGDIFGRKAVFMAGVTGFAAASLACSMAHSGDALVVSRLAQGAFAGIMVPQVLSSVQVLFKQDERAKIYGLIGAISALGSVVGLILGGWMVTANAFGIGWRSIFVVNVPIGVALLVAAALFVPNSKAEHPLKLDLLGVILSAGTVFLVEFPLIDGRLANWAWWIWAMLVAAPFVGTLFVRQQQGKLRRDGSPLLPMPLFANRGFSSGLVVQTLFWMANGGYMLTLGYYLQRGLNYTPLHTGLTLLGMTAGAMLITPAGDPLAKKFGKWVIFLGGLIQAGSFVWVIRAITQHAHGMSAWSLVFPLAVSGAGMVLLIVPLMDEALATIDASGAGAASGTFNTMQQVGFSLGVAVAGVIFFGRAGSNPTAASLRSAVIEALWMTVGAFALAGIVALFLPNHRAQKKAQAQHRQDTAMPAGAR